MSTLLGSTDGAVVEIRRSATYSMPTLTEAACHLLTAEFLPLDHDHQVYFQVITASKRGSQMTLMATQAPRWCPRGGVGLESWLEGVPDAASHALKDGNDWRGC